MVKKPNTNNINVQLDPTFYIRKQKKCNIFFSDFDDIKTMCIFEKTPLNVVADQRASIFPVLFTDVKVLLNFLHIPLSPEKAAAVFSFLIKAH